MPHKILRNGEIVDATLLEWGAWLETDERIIGHDYLQSDRYGIVLLSTIFLGIEHWGGTWFESMVFRDKGTDENGMPPPDDLVARGFWGEMERYVTMEQAQAGHARLLKELTNAGSWSSSPPQ